MLHVGTDRALPGLTFYCGMRHLKDMATEKRPSESLCEEIFKSNLSAKLVESEPDRGAEEAEAEAEAANNAETEWRKDRLRQRLRLKQRQRLKQLETAIDRYGQRQWPQSLADRQQKGKIKMQAEAEAKAEAEAVAVTVTVTES
jgi:hypothetical protein